MKKLLIGDKELKTIDKMNAAQDLVGSIIKDLYWVNNVSSEDEIMKHIKLALREFQISTGLFVTQRLMDYDEWIKDDNVQTKKEKT